MGQCFKFFSSLSSLSFFSPSPSPRRCRPRPPGRPSPAEALLQVRGEAGGGDSPPPGRARHIPGRGCLEGLAEGVDPGEAGGRGGRRGSGRRSNGGGSLGDGGGARRSSGSSSSSDTGIRAASLQQRRRALQVHSGGRPRGRAGPPGAVGLYRDVGDKFCFLFFDFGG